MSQTNLINNKSLLEQRKLDAKSINAQFKNFYQISNQYHNDTFYLVFSQKLRFSFWNSRTDINKFNLKEQVQTFIDIAKINVKCRKIWLFMLDLLGLTIVRANGQPILVAVKEVDRAKTLQGINLCYSTADSILQRIDEQSKIVRQAKALIKQFSLKSIDDLDLNLRSSISEPVLRALCGLLNK